MAAYQYVYVMQNLTKVFPGGKELFKGITLSFLPGAKIGVLGVNGAGKSTLLKIMAGVDKEFNGEAWAADGVKVGYLSKNLSLIRIKTLWKTSWTVWAKPEICLRDLKKFLPDLPNR